MVAARLRACEDTEKLGRTPKAVQKVAARLRVCEDTCAIY